PLKANVLALVEGNVLLQELLVALLLDINQVRDINDLRDLGEGLPRPEVVLDHRRRHLDSLSICSGSPGGLPHLAEAGNKNCGRAEHLSHQADREALCRSAVSSDLQWPSAGLPCRPRRGACDVEL